VILSCLFQLFWTNLWKIFGKLVKYCLDIESILDSFAPLSFAFVPWDANFVAHNVASWLALVKLKSLFPFLICHLGFFVMQTDLKRTSLSICSCFNYSSLLEKNGVGSYSCLLNLMSMVSGLYLQSIFSFC
jgi:hypothetical protein